MSLTASLFLNCSSLTDVEIPGKVKIIEHSAFQNCTSIKDIKISKNITTIGCCAFAYWKKDQNITIESKKVLIDNRYFNLVSEANINFLDEAVI